MPVKANALLIRHCSNSKLGSTYHLLSWVNPKLMWTLLKFPQSVYIRWVAPCIISNSYSVDCEKFNNYISDGSSCIFFESKPNLPFPRSRHLLHKVYSDQYFLLKIKYDHFFKNKFDKFCGATASRVILQLNKYNYASIKFLLLKQKVRFIQDSRIPCLSFDFLE